MEYDIQSIPASSQTYTSGREGCSIGHIVVHYTGAAGGAVDNGNYFAGGARGASAHYFVDSSAIVQSVDDSDTAWAVGNWGANLRTLSVEVCSAGEDFSQGERERLRWLVRTLMERHGIDADHVIRHYDCYDAYCNIGGRWIDPHKCCPAPYAPNGGDPSGAKWRELHDYITSGDAPEASSSSAPAPSGFSGMPDGAVDFPEDPLLYDGYFGPETVKQVQLCLRVHDLYSGLIDGDFGPMTKTAFQRYLANLGYYSGLIDGDFGPLSTKALQQHLRDVGTYWTDGYGWCDIDGDWGSLTTIALQRAINGNLL